MYKTKTYGLISFIGAHECTRADKKMYLEIRFETEDGEEKYVDLPIVWVGDEHGNCAEPLVDESDLTEAQREVWNAYGDASADYDQQRMERGYEP